MITHHQASIMETRPTASTGNVFYFCSLGHFLYELGATKYQNIKQLILTNTFY